MTTSYMDNGAALGAGVRGRNEWQAPPQLSWWVRHPHLATVVITVVIAVAVVAIGMGLERLTH